MFLLKWTNKFSGEQGYVGMVKKSEKHFVNADEAGAKKYRYEKQAINDIALLQEYGEADNNDFEIVSC